MADLDGRVVIVTGAGSGIGRAIVAALGAGGATCVACDIDGGAATRVAEELTSGGIRVEGRSLDVTDEAAVAGGVDDVAARFGGIDVLVNAAGILVGGTVEETSLEDWNKVLAVNLTGTFLMSRAVIIHMRRRGRGAIVNLSSSTGAHDAIGDAAAYVASKGGVTLLTKAMAIDHAKDGVRVNAVAPGPTDTPMLRAFVPSDEEAAEFAATLPVQRLGTPGEIAAVVRFLASDEASLMTGSIVAVDGGQTAAV